MELELRHLRVLCTIADAGSVGRAAVMLGASQPATSTQLRRIEAHLGAPVFVRTSSGVEPTGFGLEVLAAARDLLARADGLGRQTVAGASPARRELRLAATNSPMLPGLLTRMRSRLPELRIAVSSVYRSSDIVKQLEQGSLDAAIAVDYPGIELRHSDAVEHRGIVTEPTFVALSAGHRLRNRPEVALADLADEPWFVTPDDGAGWPGVFYDACAAAGFAPAAVHEFLGDRGELRDMIAAGLGVSTVQATARPHPAVTIKALAGTPLRARYLLVWRPATVGGELAETLYTAAVAAYRELTAGSPHFETWAARTYWGARP
ncbi:LysR family transcriptional regulator [Streptacidiphilus sp. PB12-B1b]|uniref:LysR family transcriptional regulator n=1 Tax=Streptacidiphilus sp. PB12-B1b TaxID=2705012 RepID=UPI0015FDDEA5|nr:LysR family transcriptional regulator [Streptacidiphilus sp. PB12-B1b]QMU76889.1 LysR family transcriptional regulator [Streptacidiphilus sp. PB12-B1b]